MQINKIIFFDLDGTLCPHNDLQVTPEITQLFAKFPAHHILPVVASGRSFYEVQPLLRKLKVDSYILSNGCYVVAQESVIQNQQLSNNVIEKIIKLANDRKQDVGFFNQKDYAVTGINHLTRRHMNAMHLSKALIAPEFYRTHTVNFLNLYLQKSEEVAYQKTFSNQLEFVRYAPLAVDVLPVKTSKAQTIDKLLTTMNLPNLTTYAFGDQNNDLTMFSKVDYGIAMKKATIELKRLASYVAKTDSGVIEGLRHYQLI